MDDVRRLRITTSRRSESWVDALDNPASLVYEVAGLQASYREQRDYDEYLRVSSLHDACVRQLVLGYRESLLRTDTVPLGTQVTFDIGTAVHRMIQDSPRYFARVKRGWWLCAACRHEAFGGWRRKCVRCGSSAISYVEHAGRLKRPWRVSYHVDMLVEVEPGDVRVLDIKTVSGTEFATLKKARFKDEIQVTGYALALQHDLKLPVRVRDDRGLVLYVSKRHGAMPLLLHHVRVTAAHRDFVLEKLEAFTRGIETGELPAVREECVARRFEVRDCPVVKHCAGAHV